MAEALFTLPAVSAVAIARDTVSVTKQGDAEWPEIGKEIGNAIRAQIASGEPAVGDIVPAGGEELFERVQTVLTNEINPSIANHGGVVTLQRVEEGKAFVQMGGGCQGCGMADVTLKHGIESYLRQKVPEIQEVVDVTDHAQGENPYFAFLAAADYILVTEESTNMTTEAASTGKPVFVLKLEGESLKFRLYHDELRELGAARPFAGRFEDWTYQPLDETRRAAREVLRRFDARLGVG